MSTPRVYDVELYGQHAGKAVWVDRDDDLWIGYKSDGYSSESSVLSTDSTCELILEAIQDAKPETFEEYVRENTEVAEPENPSPSPEDVAGTWIKAEFGSDVWYGPGWGLDADPDRPHPFVLTPAYPEDYDATVQRDNCLGRDSVGFAGNHVTSVDAADVPFSEVPTDE